MGRQVIDLSGQRFGRLIAQRIVDRNKHDGNTIWYCICDCGGEAVVKSNYLRNGKTKTCGCFRIELGNDGYTKNSMPSKD